MIKRFIVVYGLLMVAAVILADSGRGRWLYSTMAEIPFADKLGHFFLMGVMSFMLTLATNASRMRIGRLEFLKGPFWLAFVVTMEEFSQIWLPYRGFSLLDLAFDYLGITLMAYLAVKYRSRSRYAGCEPVSR